MNGRNSDFTEGRILGKMIRFMIPILGALILQAMYGAVDILMVGRFGTTTGISGVSTGSNIVNLVIFSIAGLSMGVTVIIGKYLGEKKEQRIGKVIGGSICFFFLLSIVLSIVMVVFARPICQLMRAPQEALDLTVTYVRICGGGIAFIIAYNVISGIFRGLGNSKLPLVFVMIACVVNIVGDYIFVKLLHMNVAGAALATVLAQALSVVLSIMIIKKQELPFHMSRKDICFNSEIRHIVKVGLPIAFQEIMTQVSFLALCAFINRLGLDASSGYGVANKIVGFVMLIPGALMQSMSSFVAQNVGAGKEKRAVKTMLCGMAMGCAIGIFVAAGTYLKGDLLAGIFAYDDVVIEKAYEYLKGFSLEAIVTCVLFSFIGYYNGHGQTLFVMLQGLAQTFLVRLPVSYFMSIQENASLTKVGLAAPAATIFGIVVNAAYFFYLRNRRQKNN